MFISLNSAIAYVGGAVLGIQMWPQIYKIFVSKSTNDISLCYLLLNSFGLLCMVTYGFLTTQPPLYIPTTICLINSCIMVMLKLFYDKNILPDKNQSLIFIEVN
jgi:uncharacterized protein with PQ loop repeat